MESNSKKIIEGVPAPYPATASAEIDSKSILMSLFNSKYIKGDINILDKYPNSDGILEMTDIDQFPLGKIDIQLKTLNSQNYVAPSYQCERSFFVYCQNSALPVILIVVNRRDKKAYWRHIDYETLLEVADKIKGNSFSLSIPKANCIDGINEDYIQAWTEEAKTTIEKVWNFDTLKEQKKAIESQFADLEKKLKAPTNLPVEILKSLHDYLDKYNYILDMEFYSIKQILYPNYWKIGMGILNFQLDHFSYVLYPIEYKKEQTLIKEVDYDQNYIFEGMSNGEIIVLAHTKIDADVFRYPLQKAYSSLEDTLTDNIAKYNFPVRDIFLAQEYLLSFVDRNYVYMDLEPNQPTYPLNEIKSKLYSVLPMLAATDLSFADWVTEANHGIDSYSSWKPSEFHKKKIQTAIKNINEGYAPKVSVTITSQIYSMDLIAYYINFLLGKDYKLITRKYAENQYDKLMYGVDFKKTWNKDILWRNTKLMLTHFFKIYGRYVHEHFSLLKSSLDIHQNENSVVYLYISDEIKGGPYLEIYSLRPNKSQKRDFFFFADTDINNPIDRKKYGIENTQDCILNNEEYQIVQMRVQTLNFMFEPSPTYAYLKINLMEKMKKIFTEKKRKYLEEPPVEFLVI